MNLRNWLGNKVPCYVCRHDTAGVRVIHVPRRLLRRYLQNRGTPVEGVLKAVKESVEKVLKFRFLDYNYSCVIYGNEDCFVINLVKYKNVAGGEVADGFEGVQNPS